MNYRAVVLALSCAAVVGLAHAEESRTLRKIREAGVITLGYREQMVPLSYLAIARGTLSRIEIQGLGLSNLTVLFGDLPGYDSNRGLLGMDFLRHFSMAVDHDLGRMTLRLR